MLKSLSGRRARAPLSGARLRSLSHRRQTAERGQKFSHLLCGFGSAEQIALRFGAAFSFQNLELFLRFDAFGGRDNAKAAAQADNGANDRQTVLFLRQVPNEALIDLDPVEREAAKISKR